MTLKDDNSTTKYNMLKIKRCLLKKMKMLKMKILKMTDESRLEKKRRKQMTRWLDM